MSGLESLEEGKMATHSSSLGLRILTNRRVCQAIVHRGRKSQTEATEHACLQVARIRMPKELDLVIGYWVLNIYAINVL